MASGIDLLAQTETLRASLPLLNERDRGFADSLLQAYRGRGLSEKQAFWVGELVKRATAARQPAGPRIAADLAPILALFATARGSLARPSVALQTQATGAIRISLAGDTSREPGTLVVTTGGSFAQRAFLGRVRRDGTWAPSTNLSRLGVDADALLALLARLAADPKAVAQEHGRLTGQCSFCQRALSDDRSVAMGIGPICAEKWGIERISADEARAALAPMRVAAFA